MAIEMRTPPHDYPTLIAHSFAGLPTDQQTPEGFVTQRAAMRATFLRMFRAEGMDPDTQGRELGNFAFAADSFEQERFGRVVTPPAPPSQYDYPELIESWFNDLAKDRQTPEGIVEHLDVIRTTISRSMAEAGLDRDALTRELALFDAEARASLPARFGDFATQAISPAATTAPSHRKSPKPGSDVTAGRKGRQDPPTKRVAQLPGLEEPLGFWRWVGVVWLAGGWAAGVSGALAALMAPLLDIGSIKPVYFIIAILSLSVIVLAAVIPMLADTVRRYRGVGFVLFWLPMILFSMGIATVPMQLIVQLTGRMGPDFVPLSLLLSVALYAAAAIPSLWFTARRFFGPRKPLTEPGEDDRTHPVMALLLTGFSVLFFSSGAGIMLNWGPEPALVAGIFVTGLIIRIFYDREIGFGFVLIVALPLALLTAEMPPSNLSVLTVLVLAIAAAFIAFLITAFRGARRTTFVSGLTAAALALLLVMAPTGPSPAMRASEWTSNAARPLADRLMAAYAAFYRTQYGQPILAMIGGFNSAAAKVVVVQHTEIQNSIEVTVDILNTGERGLVVMELNLIDDDLVSSPSNSCDHAVVGLIFWTPLWPGDTKRETLEWTPGVDCSPKSIQVVSEKILSGLANRSRDFSIPYRIRETHAADAATLFREDARAWLEL